jgi:hypothetical protein
MESNKTTSTSIGLGTILFVVFLVMKLAKIGDVANWSWWWVTAPLWIPVLLELAVFSIALLIFAIFKRK